MPRKDLSLLALFMLGCTLCLNVNAQSKQDDWFYNPFSKNSAHHRPIGAGAIYAGNSDQTTKDWLARPNEFVINAGFPHGPEIVDSSSSDPSYTVAWGGSSGNGKTALPVSGIHIPPGKLLYDSTLNYSDVVVSTYHRHESRVREFRKWQWNNGKPTSSGYFSYDIKGLGHGSKSGERISFGAVGFAQMFGVLRGWEINTPGKKIGHALSVAATNRGNCPHVYGKTFVWPATSRDAGWDDPQNNRGSVPYGALFAIPPENKGGPKLENLGLSEAGLRLAEAMRDYGVYLQEGSGCNITAIYADQHVGKEMKWQLRQDSKKIYPYLRMVENNSRDQPTAGGGTPLAPNTAIDSDIKIKLLPPSQPELVHASNK